MNLTINLITRGRPVRLLDTVRRMLPNISLDTTRLMISVDDDDIDTIDHLPFMVKDERIIHCIRPREDALGDKWNRALLTPATVYMPCGDYTPIVTPGFDKMILDAAALFPDNIGCVYSPLANSSFPAIWCVTHGLVEKMGWMCPPYFPYWFVDHWIDDVARMIDRVSFVNIECAIGEKPPTQEMREPGFWATVFDVLRLQRRAQARAIIDSPDFIEPEWRKEVLRKHHPLIEYRSQWINDVVRSWKFDPALEPPRTERYDRMREKAVAIINEWIPAVQADTGYAP